MSLWRTRLSNFWPCFYWPVALLLWLSLYRLVVEPKPGALVFGVWVVVNLAVALVFVQGAIRGLYSIFTQRLLPPWLGLLIVFLLSAGLISLLAAIDYVRLLWLGRGVEYGEIFQRHIPNLCFILLASALQARSNFQLLTAKGYPQSYPLAYWLCQLFGWGMAVFTWMVLYLGGPKDSMPLQAFMTWVVIVCVLSLLVSHVFLRPWCRSLWRLSAGQRFGNSLLGVMASTLLLLCIEVIFMLAVFGMAGDQQQATNWMELLLRLVMYSFFFAMWALIYSVWLELQRRQQDMQQQLQLQSSLRESQLAELKKQLNPHFLFNSLNSLRSLIIKDQQQARTMVTELSSLLRYTLVQGDKDQVALAEEIATVQSYLAIESLRYGDRLRVQWKILEGLDDIYVLPLSLQTLVENAVKHGINHCHDGVDINIRLSLKGESELLMQVENSGVLESSAQGTGIGMNNLRQRLQLQFGDQACVTLMAQGEQTVRAELVQPLFPENRKIG